MAAATLTRMRSLIVGILLSSTTVLAEPTAAPVQPASPAPAPAVPAPSASPTPSTTPAPPSAPAPAAIPRGNGLTLVVVADLPPKCRDLGKLADSPSQNQALSARTSLASCLIEERVKSIVLCDCEQSVRDLETASVQSLALLDEVIQVGDPALKILALQVQADLLASFATRIIATVPQPIDANESSIALRDTRLSLIQPHVIPWQQRARSAYQQMETIARANPQLAKNAAVVAALRSSRTKLATLAPPQVATAPSQPAPAPAPAPQNANPPPANPAPPANPPQAANPPPANPPKTATR